MLNIITLNGYVLLFISKQILARQPLILSGYKDHQKDVVSVWVAHLDQDSVKGLWSDWE